MTVTYTCAPLFSRFSTIFNISLAHQPSTVHGIVCNCLNSDIQSLCRYTEAVILWSNLNPDPEPRSRSDKSITTNREDPLDPRSGYDKLITALNQEAKAQNENNAKNRT